MAKTVFTYLEYLEFTNAAEFKKFRRMSGITQRECRQGDRLIEEIQKWLIEHKKKK